MSALLRIVIVLGLFGPAVTTGPSWSAAPKAQPSVEVESHARGAPGALQRQAKPEAPQSKTKLLDNYFALLQATSDESLAGRIISKIWKTWYTSDNTKINDLISLTVIFADEGSYKAALVEINKVIKMAPDFAEGWNRRATVYYLMGKYELSLADIDKTLALEPRHFGALSGRGLIYHARKEYKKALQAFEAALRLNPFLKERHGLIPFLRQKIGEQKI